MVLLSSKAWEKKSAISDLENGLDSQVKLKVTVNFLILRNMKTKTNSLYKNMRVFV